MVDVELLAQHPFTSGLAGPQRRELAACAGVARFAAGAEVFREGGNADTLYLLRSGRVVLFQFVPGRGDRQLEELRGGDILGLSWMFPGTRWVLNARATEASEAIAIESGCLLRLMRSDPALGVELSNRLLRQLYDRLERVRLQRLDVYQDAGAAPR